MKKIIKLNKHELQSGSDRVSHAEWLILQLPTTHDGRNTWLLNYGISYEAVKFRNKRNIKFSKKTKSARLAKSKGESK